MKRFVVTQEHDELWWVRDDASSLYCYPSEEEARRAALALAKDATESGAAAEVLIKPAKLDLRVEIEDTTSRRRFTGM